MADFVIRKREASLSKADPELSHHLKVVRQTAPDTAKYLAKRMFVDSMVDGVGNKLAYEDFLSRPREGVHVMLDGNDFGHTNKTWGQSAGDEAIRAYGGAISRASRKHRGKLFRVGGDEFRAFFERPEHAYSFVRHLRDEFEQLPPLKGQFRYSASVGFGHNPGDAEQALIMAKSAKKAAGYAPGHAFTHAHSLLRGAVGPVPVTREPEIPVGVKPGIGLDQRPMPMPSVEPPDHGPAHQRSLVKSVLHDNPHEPFPVWRVENEHGEGPYQTGLRDNGGANRPGPKDDFEPEDMERFHQPGCGSLRFGFLNPKDAETWFGNQLGDLRGAGFALRRVLARKVWLSTSGRQVFFEPHKP